MAYGSDRNQFADLRFPAGHGPHPLAICIHGGFWRARYDLEYCGHLCAALTAKGVATANLEYRRVGNAGGGWPGSFADIRSAYQFLTQKAPQYKFDGHRVIVLGHSAGGQLALCLAAHEAGIAGAVSLAGVVDLQRAYQLHLSYDAVVEFLGGRPTEVGGSLPGSRPDEAIDRARQRIAHGQRQTILSRRKSVRDMWT